MVAPIDPSKKSLQGNSSSVVVRQSETLQISSGPLPDPETLGKYEKVYPGLAKCIVESFESEYRHRHEMEAIEIRADVSAMELAHADVKRGQLLGFLISIIGILVGGRLVYFQHDVAGSVIGASGLASVLAAFFKGSAATGPQPDLPQKNVTL